MIVLCSWCIRAERPSFLREKEPYGDTQISHGMCEEHEAEFRAEAERLHADRSAAQA